jgi:hypothetical protein
VAKENVKKDERLLLKKGKYYALVEVTEDQRNTVDVLPATADPFVVIETLEDGSNSRDGLLAIVVERRSLLPDKYIRKHRVDMVNSVIEVLWIPSLVAFVVDRPRVFSVLGPVFRSFRSFRRRPVRFLEHPYKT